VGGQAVDGVGGWKEEEEGLELEGDSEEGQGDELLSRHRIHLRVWV
tara:strand:- start:2157 stop:2294 length:138 start_codon:yes stop_codon:yes gene_type:complete